MKKIKVSRNLCRFFVVLFFTIFAINMFQENIQKATIVNAAGKQNDIRGHLGAGVNIGNSLDCYSGHKLSNTLDYETYWNNPVITQEFVNLIADSGFKTVRIPVTWDQHLLEDGKTIDPLWMDRVKEVVGYAYNKGLYVIIDAHHDKWITTKKDNYTQTEAMTVSIWRQIANTFKEYDEHVLFEGFNEPCFDEELGWTNRDNNSYEVLNKLNQVFVNTVRKTGGNNKNRWLLLATYYNSCEKEALDAFVPVKDSKTLVSIHFYTPFKFTGNDTSNENNTSYWAADDYQSVKTMKEHIKNIVQFEEEKNVKVIVTEMGAINKNNLKERKEWTRFVTTKFKDANIPYIWWEDTNSADKTNSYSLFDRSNNKVLYPELVKILLREK